MPTIVYSAKKDPDEERLTQCVAFTRVVICRSVEELKSCLNVPTAARKNVIAIVRDDDELTKLIGVIEQNFDLLLIVVLAGDLPETSARIHRLRPRYITYKDGDFQDVASVLKRIADQAT